MTPAPHRFRYDPGERLDAQIGRALEGLVRDVTERLRGPLVARLDALRAEVRALDERVARLERGVREERRGGGPLLFPRHRGDRAARCLAAGCERAPRTRNLCPPCYRRFLALAKRHPDWTEARVVEALALGPGTS